MRSKAKNEELIVESFVNRAKENAEMAAAFNLYRYRCELKIIDEAIENKRPVPTDSDNKFKRAIIDNTVNAYRRKETQRLSEVKRDCLERIERFRDRCEKEGIILTTVTEESLRLMAAKAFENDETGLQKIYFAMLLCLREGDGDEEFIFGEESLSGISEILFDDAQKIRRIGEKFFENFCEISDGNFWERNKYFLIGAGVSLALVSVLTPLALCIGAAGSAVLTSCLAQIGHCAPYMVGAGIAGVTGMTVLGSMVVGGAVFAGLGIGELLRKGQAKEAFRKLTPDDLAALLAMKATLMDFGTATLDLESLKAEMDGCLTGLGDLRSDAEYMLIVEKCDADNCKKKIRICNRFVSRLATIAGI